MPTTMTSEGEITLPKHVRDHLGLEPGDEVTFELADDGSILMRAARGATKNAVEGHFDSLVGIHGRGHSTDEFMEMVRGYSADKDDPGFR